MQLSERECWNIIRKLVSNKNKEYARFLSSNIGTDKLPLCIGYTKNLYLSKFGLRGEREFRYLLKRRGVKPKSEWLDNLSSEDLLLFLDFRCRTLQKMYDFCAKHGKISVDDIKDLIVGTKRSSLIEYNAGRLKAIGEDELDIELDDNLIEQALLQTMHKVALGYSQRVGATIDVALEKASNLTTSNEDLDGFITGHQFMSKNELKNMHKQYLTGYKDEEIDTSEPHIVGYDVNKFPVFMQGNHFITLTGQIIRGGVEVVYDVDGNKIEHEEDFGSQTRFVGFDIQGTPIYEDEDGYYNSIGERLPDDVYIDNQDNLFSR
ncbi:MAG: hypothetical protein IJ458_04735 [Clostridia bacterium]|nr:hypothetical protein [Clostridia bacterium]